MDILNTGKLFRPGRAGDRGMERRDPPRAAPGPRGARTRTPGGPVDAFMAADSGTAEIAAKRFLHKRAFLSGGIMILARTSPVRARFTCFWGEILHHCPSGVLAGEVGGLRVASAASLRDYRARSAQLRWSPGRPAQPGR
jgi:hypothetical protein